MSEELTKRQLLKLLKKATSKVDAAYWELQGAIANLEDDESQQQLLDANERKPATIESELDNLEKHEGNGGAV